MRKLKLTILFLCLAALKINAQSDFFNLPASIYALNFNVTTEKQLKSIFGKPDVKRKSDKHTCVKFKYKDVTYEYKEQGLLFIFSISDSNKTYTLSHIGILYNSPIKIGKGVQVGVSTYDQVISDLGKPTYQFYMDVSPELHYYPKENKRWEYWLTLTDLGNGKKLSKVSIFPRQNTHL
jgi:hypothetical protein